MSDREQIRKLGQKEAIKNKWIMENNNFRYFKDKGELVVHLFRHLGAWRGFSTRSIQKRFRLLG